MGDITPEQFKLQCHVDLQSAPGLDGWSAEDLELLSDLVYKVLVDMLNSIEKGAPWPKAMQATRAVFLSKDANDIHNPLAYRILKITSGIYGKWASMTMGHLQDWIQQWDEDAILAGVPGKGAPDGFTNTAIDLEFARTCNLLVAGGSIDIYKCFDQPSRHLIYHLAKHAGMLGRILQAYSNYVEGMQVQFQIGKTIGQVHQDRASLPQGCPFSMTMVALLLKPWVSVMHQANVTPRCLADDLLIIATGNHHQSRYINAMNLSRQFFHDIGAKVADKKCFSFAGDTKTREFLANYRWNDHSLQIPTVCNFRDIGAHLNLSSTNNGKTLTDRMAKATHMVKRLRWLPAPVQFKEQMSGLMSYRLGSVRSKSPGLIRLCLGHFVPPLPTLLGPDPPGPVTI